MRILYLTHRLPFPPDKGDKIRAYHLIRCLGTRHAIDVAALCDDPADLSLERRAGVKRHCRRLELAPRPRSTALLASLRAIPSGIAASLPFFRSPRLVRTVRAWLEVGRYDAAIAHSAPMAQYVPATRGLVRIADVCDVDSVKWSQYAASTSFPRNAVFRREAAAMSAWERKLGEEWDAVTLVSSSEAELFRQRNGGERVSVVSNGVDGDHFLPGEEKARDLATVVFTGAMDYPPNVEGVLWFHAKVWPEVRAAIPWARLLVVGPRPADSIRSLNGAGSGVEITGYVPDVRVPLARATVAVAPLRIARGVQNKVLEAMAAGLPVVATSAAHQGISAEAGRDLIVADEPAQFAREVVALIRDRSHRARLSARGRAAVVAGHSWEANASVLERIILQARSRARLAGERAGECAS